MFSEIVGFLAQRRITPNWGEVDNRGGAIVFTALSWYVPSGLSDLLADVRHSITSHGDNVFCVVWENAK